MGEGKRKPDRRVARTRAQLREALMALIVERGFDAVTVQDIADRANIGRATFYLHYKDKEELLLTSMKEVYDDLVQRTDMTKVRDFLAKGLSPSFVAFEHVRENAAFYRLMFSQQGVASFTAGVRQYLAEIAKELFEALLPPNTQPRVPLDMLAAYIAGAEIGLVAWWLENGMQQTPEEMSRLFHHLGTYGANWAMGMPMPTPPEEEG
jgi:AcrR family transcriptional regulator